MVEFVVFHKMKEINIYHKKGLRICPSTFQPWGGWVILMSTPCPFPLKGEMFFDLCGLLGWELWNGP